MADFNSAHSFTATWEGGLSDALHDRGGITKYGISLVFLRDAAAVQKNRDVLDRIGIILPVTERTIRELTLDQAESLYRYFFWSSLRLETLPQRPATLLYDMAVNHGPTRAVKLVQRGYNACVGPYGSRLDEDGILGPATRTALEHDTDLILRAIVAARESYYRAIVARDATQGMFLRGWLRRCTALARTLEVA